MELPQIRAFEVNDSEHAPAFVRDMIVETLSRSLRWGRILHNLVPPFQRFLELTGAREVLDLCAGFAGPATILASEMARSGLAPPRFVLTDLYPRPDSWRDARDAHPDHIDFVPEPVDATQIPEALAKGRARTIINALHHFPPDLVQAMFADAVKSSRGIFIAEAFERNPLQFLNLAPAGLAALLANPVLAKRDHLKRAALTWLSPIALGISTWDGVVSTLRVYTEADLRQIVAPLGDSFTWEYGHYRYPPFGKGTYFYGVPTRV